MTDQVLNAFLRRQRDEGLWMSSGSDLLHLLPIGSSGDRYLAHFSCRGLVQREAAGIEEAESFDVGICFPADYLRTANPFHVLTWLGPQDVWHPNISGESRAICTGRLVPGTGLVDILYQVFEIITWNKVTMREDDALNRAACQWARRNPHRFPVDRRPLRRAAAASRITEVVGHGESDGQAR
jgi:hypothetical protein